MGFFIYNCVMDYFKKYLVKKRYDLLSMGCIILMCSVNVLFAIPAIVFLIIGVSKSEH